MTNKNDFMVFKRYKEELELILRQNPYEQELHSVFAYIIRACMIQDGISLRDVSADRIAIRISTRNLMSERRFPDFVILDKAYSTHEKANRKNPYQSGIYGAVEIKWISKSLDKTKYIDHLKGYLAYFKRVIYTNGLEWRFYGWNKDGTIAETQDNNKKILLPSMSFTLGAMNPQSNTEIIWYDDPNRQESEQQKEEDRWEELLDYLRVIQWKKLENK